ncbi:MAG: hypothetical protein ACWA47_02185 [Brevirhabdus sp.]
MGVLEDLADTLAKEALEAAEKLGDENLVNDIAKQLGSSSTTMEEAYLTSIRIRSSEIRARRYLEQRIKAAIAEKKAENG